MDVDRHRCTGVLSRNWVAHLSVRDGVQCLRRAELLKVGNSQRIDAVLNGAGMAKLADTYEH